jgi:23S rRNA pseudouridine2605 synthase
MPEEISEEAAADVEPRPEPKLERLQKILSQAGISSRRRAEELIVEGRVIVNGQVVTALGSKADPTRDHIRVDGKLLHGAERHRYFLLNKPRGYVTTVSDPEGRPTVMEFFAKLRERVYPVGRLDYQSEGLLLVTNDGELANLLTRAGSGVEKTYLVKVAGQPTAEQLERLRAGVAIEKGAPGSERVSSAPARIQQVREGENPWFEVVLIEGRNRELRKMFSAIGHFAEKIRRVGYGPLHLDVEPGQMRELTAEEVNALRLAAEGKLKPRRVKAAQMLPRAAGVPAGQRAERRGGKDFDRRPNRDFARPAQREDRGERRPEKPAARGGRPQWKREDRGPKREWQPRDREFRGGLKDEKEFREQKPFARQAPHFEERQRGPFKPHGERPEFRGGPRREFGGQIQNEGSEKRPGSAMRRSFPPRGERPAWKRQGEFKPRGEFSKPFEKRQAGSSGKAGRFGGGKPKPAFGGKPGGFGKFREKGGDGARSGFSRPGPRRGGWKRG